MKYEEYKVRVFENHTQWFQNGVLHRVGGPAKEYLNGSKVWFKNGQLHREDGPAVEHANGDKKWFIEGVQYCEEDFLAFKKFPIPRIQSEKSYAGTTIVFEGKTYKLVECTPNHPIIGKFINHEK